MATSRPAVTARRACGNAHRLPPVIAKAGHVEAVCNCGDSVTMPDTGLGRANVAAWLTRHQGPTP